MRIKVEVGQVFAAENSPSDVYRIVEIGTPGEFNRCVSVTYTSPYVYDFRVVGPDGLTDIIGWKLIKSEKIIPGIPLDPTLPILQAGHLQDRQRKLYRNKK